MNKKQLFCLIISVLAQITFAEITLEDITAGIKNRQNLIKSAKLDFSYEYSQPIHESFSGNDTDFEIETSKILVFNYETLRLDKKNRIKQIQKDPTTGNDMNLELVAWDGQVRTAYVENLAQKESNPGGTVKGTMGSFYSGYWPTAMEMWVFDVQKPLSEILENASLQLGGSEKIGVDEAVKVTAKDFFGEAATLEVWIAPKKDFAPVKLRMIFDMQEPKKDIILTMDKVKLENKDNVWLIMESAIKVVNLNASKNLKGTVSYFKASNYQLNIPIDEKMFKIDFPKGTPVYDSILQQGYIVGEGMVVTNAKGEGEYIPFELAPEFKNEIASPTGIGKKVTPLEEIKADNSSTPQVPKDDKKLAVTETVSQKQTLLYVITVLIAIICVTALAIRVWRRNNNE